MWKLVRNWFNAPGRTPFRPPLRLFWVGWFVRLAYVTLAHTYRINHYSWDDFGFGWEAGRIARSLALGHGYSDPFVQGGTGPTAWLPPLFPWMIAGCFKLFGVYTPLAAWTVLALDSLFSAATSLAVYEIGARCLDRRVAIWSGWLWALYPAAMQYSVKWVWETTLTTMLFAWVLVLALRVRGIAQQPEPGEPQTLTRWLLFGLLWGLIALCNPSVCLFLPVCGVWMLLHAQSLRRALPMAVAAGLLFFACLVPWTWRNWKVFHAMIPIRGNFGAENWYGNGPDAQGFPWGVIIASKPDLERYATLGEPGYVKALGAKASAYIHDHPAHFLGLTIKRFYFFWASVPHPLAKSAFLEYFREYHFCFLSICGLLGLALALRNNIPGAALFAWAFALLPVTYYLVTAAARFRHPLEPLITVLAVYLFQSAEQSSKRTPSDADATFVRKSPSHRTPSSPPGYAQS